MLHHDQEMEHTINTPCNKPDCFKMDLNYGTDMIKIASLIETSQSCQQQIKFSCYLSKIKNHARWRDRHGKFHSFESCECYKNSSCYSLINENTCNCNMGDTFTRNDIITVTDMKSLPITSFQYGYAHMDQQYAVVEVGPLECYGSKPLPKSGKTCNDLRLLGQPSGYYFVEKK